MAVMAKWRSKTWEVSTRKVNAIAGLSFSYKMKAETNTDLEDSPSTNERGMELMPLSFETQLHSAAGIDVRQEIESWQALVMKTGSFYLAGQKLGPNMQLKEVSAGNIQLDDFGRMRAAKLSFTFEEANPDTTKTPSSTTTALNVGAQTASKSEKKPENSQVKSSTKTTIKVGSYVKPTGSNYATGQKIPAWVKQRSHKVSQIKGDRTLLGSPDGINSWVYTNELTLV